MKENLIDNHWQEFLINPLNVIDRLYNQQNGESSVEEFHNFIKEQFTNLLKSDPSKIEQIPYLNNRNTNYDNLRNKSLIRYRCMIQDMFDQEICAVLLSSQNGQKKINLYTDSVYLNEKYFINPNKNTIMDRYIYYMISIPGVNEWVKKYWDEEGKTENLDQSFLNQEKNTNFKRHLNDELIQSDDKDENGLIKKKKTNESNKDQNQVGQTICTKKKDYCTPIKTEEELNKPVIVKVYNRELEFKLNDIVEIVGIIEFPNFENRNILTESGYNEQCPEISSMLNNLDLDHEDYVYSELPRIHALQINQLTTINPFNEFNSDNCKVNSSTYNKLINLFEKMFFGDKLTSQYFICWLISHVYKIQDSLPIGNFPINISNLHEIPNDEHHLFIQKFYQIVEALCTHSIIFPITISGLNNLILNPFKEKDSSKLQTGLLQLPTNFVLILDETSLQAGKLKEMGIKNLKSIQEMIKWQTVEYDHLFFTQKMNSDINVLVLSEGKSLFEVSCQIKLKPAERYTNIDELFNLINYCLNDNLKKEFRNYLNYVRSINCEMQPNLQEKIQEDFVQMRKDFTNKIGPKISSDDLHQFIALSRLLAMSEGSRIISDQHWEKAKLMELERRTRFSN